MSPALIHSLIMFQPRTQALKSVAELGCIITMERSNNWNTASAALKPTSIPSGNGGDSNAP